jgi:predicted transcriptional regulator
MPQKQPKTKRTRSKKGDQGRTPGEALAIELRREKAITMYLQRVKQARIAEVLGVSQATISDDIAQMREKINERAAAATVQLQAEEIATIDEVESAAWASFRASKKKGRHAEAGGNPRFLDIVLDCSDRRRRVLGLDKQSKGEGAKGLLEFLATSLQDAADSIPERNGPREIPGFMKPTNGKA